MERFTITEQVHADADTAFYRGFRNSDRSPVSVKLLKGARQSPERAASLRYEYRMIRDLAFPGVVTAYGLEPYEGGLALVMDDPGERPLREVLSTRGVDLAAALGVATSVAETLDALHRRHVIHKNINPRTILINARTGAARLCDFGIATRLVQETPRAEGPEALAAALPYVSPEQTGRMNRTLDHRTDLYSLGVVLYEMLTGRPPFQSADPMEVVHGHIARRPAAPHELSPATPRVVSDVVMKLLAKAAEDRYQSAFGLAADLREARARLAAAGAVEPFPLGRRDLSGELRVSQRLYGREAEVARLLGAFDRASGGGAELLLVAGFSGIGKSALVNEVHKPIAARGGAFVAGKFDLINRSVPYAPIANAFRELVRGLLQRPAAELAALKEKLARALGPNAQLLVDLIPELASVLGPQPPAPELGPTESQNRFALVFQSFLRALTTKGRPLVVFLDDLQWADPASLRLLQTVLANPENAYLLVLGAYRDNEVGPAHPLAAALEEMKKAGARLDEIALQPLGLGTVGQLVADTLAADVDRARPLAELVFEKTRGNPFFVSQLLGELHRDRLLGFNASAGVWEWDLEGIRRADITDNVVTLMVGKLRGLAPDTQRVLRLAACVGHQFDLRTLAVIHEKSPVATAADLWEALDEGLIVPLTAEYRFLHAPAGGEGEPPEVGSFRIAYKFLHDRVQQAAYSSIEAEQRQAVHLKIGRLLRESRAGEADEADAFQIVYHANIGAPLITDRRERVDLARLNLAVGKRAKAATAYPTAAGYFEAGARLLGDEGWGDDYELAFALTQQLAECKYLGGHPNEAEALFDLLLGRAKTDVECAAIYDMCVVLYCTQIRYDEALAAGRAALTMLGIDLGPTEAEWGAALGAELAQVPANLGGRRVDELIDAPPMTDPAKRTAVRVLTNLCAAAFVLNPVLLALTCVTPANLALKHGHSDETPFAYMLYGSVLATTGRYQQAYEFGRLALDLNERYGNASVTCKLHLFFSLHVSYGSKPLKLSLEHARLAMRAGLESGDLNFLSYSVANVVWTRTSLGDELGDFGEEIEKLLPLARQINNPEITLKVTIGRQVVACLRGQTAGLHSIGDEGFDEAALVEELKAPELVSTVGWYQACKLRLALLAEDYPGAIAAGVVADRVAGASTGIIFTADQAFHLCLAVLGRPAAEASREPLEALFEANRAKIASLAEGCPENFLHKLLLIEAEQARAAGRPLEAMGLYDRSIRAAGANGFVHDEALANELASKFYRGLGRERVADAYLGEARRCYRAWGATAKLAQLDAKYGAPAAARPEGLALSAAPAALDLMTVVKAAQALSGEIDLDRLLQKLMRITIENAGAQRGYLLRHRGGELLLAAEAAADGEAVKVYRPAEAPSASALPLTILNHVRRAREGVVLDRASAEPRYAGDEYVARRQTKSALCLPLLRRTELVGLLYLENDLAEGAFTPERTATLELLASQAAISLENATLYADLSQENAERRRAEEALRRLNEELERRVADRTAQLHVANKELEAFSYSVSHDLRSPLKAIDRFAAALEKNHGAGLGAEGQEYLGRVRSAAKRMGSLIEDMLGLSRVARAELRRGRVDLSELARGVVAELRRADPEREVEVVVADGASAEGDANLLKIALENLLSNAWKYTSKRARATIEFGAEARPDGRTAYFVRDDGAGFDAARAEELFAPFRRLHDAAEFPGTGVGLATVQRIVSRHGGRVWAEGAVGRGATFYFTL
ncbi:MAG TPA: AAA family ATPase [Polyangiaceae bacterium]|nr:AAA family ATPase [Polyangiaceae bacterium]